VSRSEVPQEDPPLAGIPAREALERTGIGVAVADAEGHLVLISPAMQEMFQVGAQAWEMEGLEARYGLRDADGAPLARPDAPMARACRGEFVKNFVLGAHNSRGELIWLSCNAAPLRDAEGRPNGGFVLSQDITAQRRSAEAREALRQRLVHTVDHEFRTPLAALIGHLELVRDHHGQLPPELAVVLCAIERSGWELRDLVEKVAGLIEAQDELHRSGLVAGPDRRTPHG
jgi:PAS domain S-box-containing protein